MSSRLGNADVSYGEINLEKLKQERRITEQNINSLERERDSLDAQMAELERRRNDVNNRLRVETEIALKQERSIEQADVAYKKIVDSSRTLAEFVKNEYQGTRRE